MPHSPFLSPVVIILIYITYCNSAQRSNLDCPFTTTTAITFLSDLLKQSGTFPVSNVFSFPALFFPTSVDRAWLSVEMLGVACPCSMLGEKVLAPRAVCPGVCREGATPQHDLQEKSQVIYCRVPASSFKGHRLLQQLQLFHNRVGR